MGAHISLVFREIWDTTAVDRSAHRMHRESEGKSRGIPHLAKNERDVGHPSGYGRGQSPEVQGYCSTATPCAGKVSWEDGAASFDSRSFMAEASAIDWLLVE
jgi:hypothetical protein